MMQSSVEVLTRPFGDRTGAAVRSGIQPRITVCQLLHSLNVGGAEILATRLSRRLQDRFRFVFACLDSIGPLGEELRANGFEVDLVGRKAGFDWTCAIRLARLLREHQVDLMHAHQYTPFFYGLISRLCGWRRPILFTEHGRHQPDYPRRKRMLANRMLLSRRDRVVGVGAAVRQALIENEGFRSARVSVLYNGIDVSAYSGNHSRAEARTIFKASTDDFILVQVARFDYLKDHLTALRALARVVIQQPKVRLVLIGDGPERPAIESEIRRLGLGGHVQLLGTRGDVNRLLCGADLFLLTSTSEGIPLTMLEAMAAGLPVISTDVGGVNEVVVPNVTGLLASARDDAMLSDHLLRLATDRELGRRMGKAGHVRARECFDESRMSADYGALYQEMVRV